MDFSLLFFLFQILFISSDIRSASSQPIIFLWINDNTGALAWADKIKASWLPSASTNISVAAYQVLTNVALVGSAWIPGLTMGVIYHESRREEHLLADDYDSSELSPDLFIDLESNSAVMSIISMCNPHSASCYDVDVFHNIFQDIYGYLHGIVRLKSVCFLFNSTQLQLFSF